MEENYATCDVVLSSTPRKMKPESHQSSRCNLTTNLEKIPGAELPVTLQEYPRAVSKLWETV